MCIRDRIRTRYGVYPMGGKFDNNSFRATTNSGIDGALGEGVHPILPSFFINFYRAEMAAINGDAATAREQLLLGVEGSIAKALNFISRDQASLTEVVAEDLDGNQLLGELFLPTADNVADYLAEVETIFDESDDILDVIAQEFLIATWGNGLEGYNLILSLIHI